MGSSEVLDNGAVRNGNGLKSRGEDDLEGITNGGFEQMVNGAKENENLGDEILEDFETYWEDVNDRLMVSRMVSDSVIKGIVRAVEQEAAERLVAKDMELANLKEYLQFHDRGLSKIENESLGSPMSQDELESMNFRKCMTLSDVFMEHGKMGDSLDGLRGLAKDEFKKLKKSIDELRVSNSIRNRSSRFEIVELEGVLQEKESGIWVQLDKALDNMRMMVDTVFKQMDVMLQLSKTSLGQWQEEHLIEVELEAMVMRSLIQTVQEEFEYKLWDQYAQLCGDRNEKLNAISCLRTELDAVLKSLSSSEYGHGSHDADCCTHKTSSEYVTSSKSVLDGNGKLEDSKTDIPENFDAVMLKHMSKDEIVTYFNNIMTKMKRHHESILQKKTDEYFALRGEYLNLRGGSALPHKKDKGESDILRRKIPEIIVKLDDILVENEKHPAFTQETLSFVNLKDRLDNLLSENHQLRDLLKDKKNEVKSLLSQVSDATEKRLQHSLAEAGMLKQIGDLNLAMHESLIEASVREDVYTCFLRDLSGGARNEVEELNLGFDMLNESNDTNAGSTRKIEIEDSEMECLIMQEICGVIFGEGIKEAEDVLQELYWEHLNEKEIQISLDTKVIEMENKLKFEVDGKDSLKQMVSVLETLVNEKEKLATDASAALVKERDQFKQVCQELNAVKEFACQQQTLASGCNKEVNVVKGQLAEALERIEVLKEKAAQLNKSLGEKAEELKEANHRANTVLAISEERQTLLSSLESKEIELRKQVETIIGNINESSKMVADFECRVTGMLRTNIARFEHSYSQLVSLAKKANLLRRTTLLYQERLEKRCSDLQLAEAEVDLLGDEVDTLLSLVEKIYIALDHYSPVLQHYPGIMEILKVIKRELTGESTKLVK